MWLTNKKTGKVFNTDWVNDDAVRKEKQISANKAQSKKLNTEANIKYEKMLSLEEKQKLIQDFDNRTTINVFIAHLQEVPDDTLKMILDTTENHLKEYGKKNFNFSQLVMRDNDPEFATDGGNENAYAYMGHDGTLSLNPKYFSKPKEWLDKKYQEDAESAYHPKGDSSSIIIHELGHARFNKVLADSWAKHVKDHKGTVDEYFDMQELCSSDTWLYHRNADLYSKKGSWYRTTIDRFYEFESKLIDSKTVKDMFGNLGLGLSGLINPERTTRKFGISRYATKNIHEMMAESWTDVICNGDNASYMSKQVVYVFLNVEMTFEEKARWKRGEW